MEISGKIIKINDVQTGESKNGTWKMQDFVVETDSQYPKKICFSLWGDKISKLESVVGENVTVSFDVESKEFNGKWFTEAKAWLIKKEVLNNIEENIQISKSLPIIEDDEVFPF
jgi:hypothetical protein